MIIILFLASMLFDGIILPAIFGIREGFLTIIFLITLILYYRANLRSVVAGVVFSGIAEFYWGLRLGILILPLLTVTGLFILLDTFINIKNKILIIFSGTIMFAVFWEVSILLNKFR